MDGPLKEEDERKYLNKFGKRMVGNGRAGRGLPPGANGSARRLHQKKKKTKEK